MQQISGGWIVTATALSRIGSYYLWKWATRLIKLSINGLANVEVVPHMGTRIESLSLSWFNKIRRWATSHPSLHRLYEKNFALPPFRYSKGCAPFLCKLKSFWSAWSSQDLHNRGKFCERKEAHRKGLWTTNVQSATEQFQERCSTLDT